MPDALQIRRLSSGYGETVVLEDVTLALPERGSLAVLGRNGVGKTTLLATIGPPRILSDLGHSVAGDFVQVGEGKFRSSFRPCLAGLEATEKIK